MPHAKRTALFALALAIATGGPTAGPIEAATSFSVIALSGARAPGTPDGVIYNFFEIPVLNEAGGVAFGAYLLGPGVSPANEAGYWRSDGAGNVSLVARKGDPAPGTASGTSFAISSGDVPTAVLNGAGEVAFGSPLSGSGVTFENEYALFGPDSGGSLSLVARKGDPAPGTGPNVNFNTFGTPALNDSGAMAFFAGLAGSGVSNQGTNGLWKTDGAGGTSLVALAGELAPGTSATYSFFNQPVLNQAGEVAFRSILSSGEGIWGPDGVGNLELVARVGNPAVGTPAGTSYGGVSLPVMNDAGEIAFRGVVQGSGVTSTNNDALWGPDGAGELSLLAREGNAAPGAPSGATWSSFGNPVIDDAGGIAFSAILAGPGVTTTNDSGVWGHDAGGNLDLFLREGDAAPGLAPGVLLGNAIATPLLNDSGALLMQFGLSGAGVNGNNDRALYYARDPSSPLLILREGDALEIAPGDTRVVAAVFMLDGFAAEYGRSSFNDAGQIALRLLFSNGTTGIFVFAPEPGTGLLIASGMIAISIGRRRQASR